MRRGFFVPTDNVPWPNYEFFSGFRQNETANARRCPTPPDKKQLMQHFTPCSPSRISLSIYAILTMALYDSRVFGDDVCNATQGKRNKGMASAGLDERLVLTRPLATL